MIIPTLKEQFEILLVFLLISVAVILLSFSVSKAQFTRKIDCKPEKFWGTWSECTRNCAGGNQYRTRAVEQMAVGGANCLESDLLQSRSCNETIACGINCVPGNPANFQWTPCPQCTKNGAQPIQYKTVVPAREATYMGQDCDIDSVIMSRECSNIPPCPPDIDCEITEYTRSDCDAPCGSGTLNVFSRITRLPSGDGAECDLSQLIRQEACSNGPCGCEGLSWSGTFSECNAACGPGIKIMMRAPDVDVNPGWCPYVSTTFCSLTDCPNDTCTAPSIDFVQALCYMQCAGLPFPEIDPNICGYEPGGFSQQLLDAVCGTDPLIGIAGCAEPQDCSLTTFSGFGACSIPSCLGSEPYGGTRTRIRTIVSSGNAGGAQCVDQVFTDIQPCFNRLPVTYSSFDTLTNAFVQSVSAPQCSNDGCSLSDWFSLSGFIGGCGPCSQEWARSLSYIGNIDQCPTDPSLYFSVSTCCGKSPAAQNQKICGKLPACTQCQWQDIRDFPFNCRGVSGTQTVYRDMELVSNTNNPNRNCQTTDAFNCYYDTASAPSGAPYYGNSIFSCSKYFFSCTTGGGPGACPIGCNGLECNGQGSGIITTYTGGTSCTCDCYPGFSGPNCEIILERCPIASISELECNGLGTCSTVTSSELPFTCSCDNPNDFTSDCTGSSTSWCWVYGNAIGRFFAGTNRNNINKLLGVIPIASTSDYFFSEDDCTDLELITIDDGYKASFTYLPVKPLFFASLEGVPPQVINRIGLSGRVQSNIPFALANKLSATCLDLLSVNTSSTYEILRDALGAKAEYFVPRYVPFSSPVQCESMFTIRTINGLPADYYDDSQLNLSSSVLGPVLQPYYDFFENIFASSYYVVAGPAWSPSGDGSEPDSILINTVIPQITIPSLNNGDNVEVKFAAGNSQAFQFKDDSDLMNCQPGDIFLSFSNDNNSTTINGYACGVNISALPTQQINNVVIGGLNVSGTFPGPSFLQIGLIANSSPLILPSLPDRSVVRHNMTITINNNPLFPTNPTFTTSSNLLLQNEGYFATNNTCSAESINFISTNLNYSFGVGPMPYYCTDPGQEVFTFGITTNTITYFTPFSMTLKF